MVITQEMFDDWRSPQGFADFNGDLEDYEMSFQHGVVVRREGGEVTGFAVAAKPYGGIREKQKIIPIWRSDFENMRISCMVEPEFSLEEIELSEKLVSQKG